MSSPFLHCGEAGKVNYQSPFLQRLADVSDAHRDHPSMTCSIPIGVRDLNLLVLERLLVLHPLPAKLFAFEPLALLPLAIGKKGRVDKRVLGNLDSLFRAYGEMPESRCRQSFVDGDQEERL